MSTCKKKVSPRTFEYLRRWLTRTTVDPPPPPLPAAASPAPSPSFVPGWPSPRRPGTLPRRLAGATRGSPPPARWGRVRNPESVLRINYLSPHFTTVQEIQMENWTEEVMKFLRIILPREQLGAVAASSFGRRRACRAPGRAALRPPSRPVA